MLFSVWLTVFSSSTGGVQCNVTGLLTYRILHVERLILTIGVNQIQTAIQNVVEAEISRVFSTLHLDQIASMNETTSIPTTNDSKREEMRSFICREIVEAISPMISEWGIAILNFQVSQILFTDRDFATSYEQFSLQVASTNAQKRVVVSQREIQAIEAAASAQANKIIAEAEGQVCASCLFVRAR